MQLHRPCALRSCRSRPPAGAASVPIGRRRAHQRAQRVAPVGASGDVAALLVRACDRLAVILLCAGLESPLAEHLTHANDYTSAVCRHVYPSGACEA
eukprot:366301-Chlamydomonas_euryale.AAC.59